MDAWTAVAILVSILGVVIILALVWLFYQWRGLKSSHTRNHPRCTDSPVQRYVVVRGKLVPVPGAPPPTPKSKPGRSPLQHTSCFMSSTSPHKTPELRSSKLDTYEKGPDLEAGRQWRRDMDAIRSSRSTKWSTFYHESPTSNTNSPKTPIFPPAAYRSSIPKRPLVSKYSCSPTLARPRSTPHPQSSRKRRPQIKPIIIPPPLPTARRGSFLDSPSTESLRIPFSLPLLQSRYHKPPPYDNTILLTPTQRPDTWDSLRTASQINITRSLRIATMTRLPETSLRTSQIPPLRE